MNLIPEWRKSWRLTSVQINLLTAALNAAALGWIGFDGHISPILWASVNTVLGIASAIARNIPQPKVARADQ